MAQLLRLPLLLLAALAVTLAMASSNQMGMVGGFSDADPQEKGVQRALAYAISEYNKASNDAFHSRALRVVRARKQQPDDADPQEKGVQRALAYAISEYNKASNDAFHSRALRVVRARKQVVAGMNYLLDVELGRTTCTKAQPYLADCPFHDQPHLKKVLCSFQIYSIPWMNKISLTHSNCESA
ncbi:Cystatin-C [Tupaia chinensis]|uniref:Cystatin-C n=1 Tax=Tupaia chinensis TaxID=246437 RepID=L8YDE8_TUPCH|nr:Cystatin-C [Tupaia chinensis]